MLSLMFSLNETASTRLKKLFYIADLTSGRDVGSLWFVIMLSEKKILWVPIPLSEYKIFKKVSAIEPTLHITTSPVLSTIPRHQYIVDKSFTVSEALYLYTDNHAKLLSLSFSTANVIGDSLSVENR